MPCAVLGSKGNGPLCLVALITSASSAAFLQLNFLFEKHLSANRKDGKQSQGKKQ